jgi:hypothetical protein
MSKSTKEYIKRVDDSQGKTSSKKTSSAAAGFALDCGDTDAELNPNEGQILQDGTYVPTPEDLEYVRRRHFDPATKPTEELVKF